jgi:hypothetical protein
MDIGARSVVCAACAVSYGSIGALSLDAGTDLSLDVVYIKLSVDAKDCSGRKLSEHSPFAQQSTYRQRMSAPEFQKLNSGPWAHGKVALVACMRKLLVILNAIVRDQRPFQALQT